MNRFSCPGESTNNGPTSTSGPSTRMAGSIQAAGDERCSAAGGRAVLPARGASLDAGGRCLVRDEDNTVCALPACDREAGGCWWLLSSSDVCCELT